MMPLYAKLAWRDTRSHKVRTAVAVLLFALPVIFVSVLAYTILAADSGLWRDPQPRTVHATVITSECQPDDDPTWCASAADIARTDIDRLRDSLGGEEKDFSPVWHALADVSADSDTSIVVPVTATVPESGVIGVPESGQIALSADSLKILGKKPGDTVSFAVRGQEHGPVRLIIADELVDTGSVVRSDALAGMNVSPREQIKSAEVPAGFTMEWQTGNPLVSGSSGTQRGGVSVYTQGEESDYVRNESLVRSYIAEIDTLSDALAVVTITLLNLVLIASISGTVFAVAAARNLRATGLLSCVGATSRQLAAAMLWQGGLIGAAGAVLGGILAWLGTWIFSAVNGYEFIWAWDVSLFAVVVATVSGVVSALVPAVRTARTDPTQALQRSMIAPRRLSAWMWAAPIAMIVSAFAAQVKAVADYQALFFVTVIIFGILSTPLCVYLVSRLGGGKVRFALRDARRNLHRTAPTAGAIAGVVLISSVFLEISTYSDSLDSSRGDLPVISVVASESVASDSRAYESVVSQVQTDFGAPLRSDSYELLMPPKLANTSWLPLSISQNAGVWDSWSLPSFLQSHRVFGNVVAAGPEVVDMWRHVQPDAFDNAQWNAMKDTLRSGRVVVDDQNLVRDGHVNIAAVYQSATFDSEALQRTDIDGWFAPVPTTEIAESTLLPARAFAGTGEPSGIVILPLSSVKRLGGDVVYQSSNLAGGRGLSLREKIAGVNVDNENGPEVTVSVASDSASTLHMGVVIAATWLLSLFLMILLVVLSLGESKRDRAVLAAEGASPRQLRSMSALQAVVVAEIGCIAAGVTAAVILLSTALSDLGDLDFWWRTVVTLPWGPVVVQVVGILLVAAVVGWVAGAVPPKDSLASEIADDSARRIG
ncbi:ABC transporter permease [Corynebacterium diphtheriae]|nr:ABC transporter permease [Corynebacterium diphtheriae]